MEFPHILRTHRLLLTRFEPSDLDDFLAMRNEPEVIRILGHTRAQQEAAHVQSLSDHWARHGYGWWVARDPGSGVFLGCGGLRSHTIAGVPETELAYSFLPGYWGRGYASELARVAVAQGFVRLGVRDIVGFALPENVASRRVMEKIGFLREHELLHAGRLHLLYRLNVDAWRVAPLKRGARLSHAVALQAH